MVRANRGEGRAGGGLGSTRMMRRGNTRMLLALVSSAGLMLSAAYAAVPLYNTFCRVTGYGGTTQVAAKESDKVVERVIAIRFDANVNGALPWAFQPMQREVSLKVGENAVAFYQAQNLGNRKTTGTAVFNVTPQKAGRYFSKVECFCFSEQTLAPGAKAELPVAFYVDPEITSDRNLDDVTAITLSYTFYPSDSASDEEELVSTLDVTATTDSELN